MTMKCMFDKSYDDLITLKGVRMLPFLKHVQYVQIVIEWKITLSL